MADRYDRPYLRKDGTEVMVEIEVDSWGSEPVTSGPPEACDPGDPMEVHVERAWLEPHGTPVDLTDEEKQEAEGAFCSDPPEADYGPDDDWGD